LKSARSADVERGVADRCIASRLLAPLLITGIVGILSANLSA
jgi:hypothetical protein